MLTKFKLVEITENDIEDYNGKTYDLEVEEDHSYTANNIIVHNSVCTTRKKTGVGYPQLSAIIECADAAHGLNALICGDGGITNSGDVVKAFGAGADFIMCGGMFAGHDECEGEIENYSKTLKPNIKVDSIEKMSSNSIVYAYSLFGEKNSPYFTVEVDFSLLEKGFDEDEKTFKMKLEEKLPDEFFNIDKSNAKMKFYGMSSEDAMNKHYNGKANYRASEGKTVYVDYKGPVENTVIDILGGLRSACTYTGAKSLKQLSKCTTFIRVSQQLNEVFGKS